MSDSELSGEVKEGQENNIISSNSNNNASNSSNHFNNNRKILQSEYIPASQATNAVYGGDKLINNNYNLNSMSSQQEINSYSHRSQHLGNISTNTQNNNNQDLMQLNFDDNLNSSSRHQQNYYINQNQFMQQQQQQQQSQQQPINNYNNFITDLKNFKGAEFNYSSQADNMNYHPAINNQNYSLGGGVYIQNKSNMIGNLSNNINNPNNNNNNFIKESDIGMMMNSSIQSAQSQQIIHQDISDDENERKLANHFDSGSGGSNISPDFKFEGGISTSKTDKEKQQQLQPKHFNQFEAIQGDIESANIQHADFKGEEEGGEAKRDCDCCHEVPINYIALPCTHNFCINCLMQIYMNPVLCKKDYDNFAELICQICRKPTKLDYESQIAIEAEIQQSLINNMNEENPLQMITNPNLQLEDISDHRDNMSGFGHLNHEDQFQSSSSSAAPVTASHQGHYHHHHNNMILSDDQFVGRGEEVIYKKSNSYLSMNDDSRQNQDFSVQQQQQQFFQQRYQMPKEEVIHEEESMDTYLTNETHKIIHFNTESPSQSIPKSSFYSKQLKSGTFTNNVSSSTGNILTNSLLKALHNSNSNSINNNNNNNNSSNTNLNNNNRNSVNGIINNNSSSDNQNKLLFSDFKKNLESENHNNALRFQNEDFDVKINIMLTEESESDNRNGKLDYSPITQEEKSQNRQIQKHNNNLLNVYTEDQHDSSSNILEFRRVESDLSQESNHLLTTPSHKIPSQGSGGAAATAQTSAAVGQTQGGANNNKDKPTINIQQASAQNISLPPPQNSSSQTNINLLHSIQGSVIQNKGDNIQQQQKQPQQNDFKSNVHLLQSMYQSKEFMNSVAYPLNSKAVADTPMGIASNLQLLQSMQQSKDIANMVQSNFYQPQFQPTLNQVNSNIQLLHSIQDMSSSNSYKNSMKQVISEQSIENKSPQLPAQNSQANQNQNNLQIGGDFMNEQNRNLLVSEYIPNEVEENNRCLLVSEYIPNMVEDIQVDSPLTNQTTTQSNLTNQIGNNLANNNKDSSLNSSQQSKQSKDYMRLTQTNKILSFDRAQKEQAVQDLPPKSQFGNNNNSNMNSVVGNNPNQTNGTTNSAQIKFNQDKLQSQNQKEEEEKFKGKEEHIQQQMGGTKEEQPVLSSSQQSSVENKFLRTREQIKSGGKVSYRSSRNSKSESMSENQFMQSLESNNINALSTNCNEHPLEDAQLFCFNCECKCICLTCYNDSIKHSGHQVENVMRAYPTLQQHLEHTHEEISNKIELMDSTYWNFSQSKVNVSKKYEEMQKQITQMFASIREELRVKEMELLQQLQQNQVNTLQIVDQECNKMQEARKTLETVSGKLNIIQNAQPAELTELSDCAIAFNYYAECKRILNEIISKTKIDQEPIKQFENISLVLVQQIVDNIKNGINEIKFPQPQRDIKLSPTNNNFHSLQFQLPNYLPREKQFTQIENNNNSPLINKQQTNHRINQQSNVQQIEGKEEISNVDNIAKFKSYLHNQSESPNYSTYKKTFFLDKKGYHVHQSSSPTYSSTSGNYQNIRSKNISKSNQGLNSIQSEKQVNFSETQRELYLNTSNNNQSTRSNHSKKSPVGIKNNAYFMTTTPYTEDLLLQQQSQLQQQLHSANNIRSVDSLEQQQQSNQTVLLKISQLETKDLMRDNYGLGQNAGSSNNIESFNQDKQQVFTKIISQPVPTSSSQQNYSKLKASGNHLQDEIERINNSLFELQANIDLNQIFCKTEHSPMKERDDHNGYSERQQKLNSNRIQKRNSPTSAKQVNQAVSTSHIHKLFKNIQSKFDYKSQSTTTSNTQQSLSSKSLSDSKQSHLKLTNSVFSYSKKIQDNKSIKEERPKYHQKHLSDFKLSTISLSNNDITNQSNIITSTSKQQQSQFQQQSFNPQQLALYNNDKELQLYGNSQYSSGLTFNAQQTSASSSSDQLIYLPEKSVIDKLSAFQQDIKNSSSFQKELRKKEIDWMKSKTITLLKKSEVQFQNPVQQQSQQYISTSEQESTHGQFNQQKNATPANYRSNSNINLSKISLTSATNNNNLNNFSTTNNSQFNYHSEGRKSSLSSGSHNNLRSATPKQQSSPTANYFNKATYNSSKQVLNKFSDKYTQKRLQKPKSFTSRNLLSMFDKSPSNDFFLLNQEKSFGGESKSVMNNYATHTSNFMESLNIISPIHHNNNNYNNGNQSYQQQVYLSNYNSNSNNNNNNNNTNNYPNHNNFINNNSLI